MGGWMEEGGGQERMTSRAWTAGDMQATRLMAQHKEARTKFSRPKYTRFLSKELCIEDNVIVQRLSVEATTNVFARKLSVGYTVLSDCNTYVTSCLTLPTIAAAINLSSWKS